MKTPNMFISISLDDVQDEVLEESVDAMGPELSSDDND